MKRVVVRVVVRVLFLVLIAAVLGCPPKCPLYDAEGQLIEKNLLIHMNEKYKRIVIELSENHTAMAYQRLNELSMLVKTVPTDTEPRSKVVAEALRMIGKSRAALRLGDIFEARKAVRALSASIKMMNAVLVYGGPRSRPAESPAELPAGSAAPSPETP